MPSPFPYLDGERLLRLLSPMEAIAAIEAFFASHAREEVRVPERIHLKVPGRNTFGLYMPAAIGSYIGVKLVHLMPERAPSVEAEIFLYDAPTGRLLFWGDGKPLTGLRTAGVSAAAARKLLPECRSLLVFGGGVQAAAHIVAFAAAYPELSQVSVATRTEDSFAGLRARLPEHLSVRVRRGGDTPRELASADCVITTTPAPRPLFRWEDVPPACHLVAVGSATPAMQELPEDAFLESRVWVDTRAALHESGDCLAAERQGWREEHLSGDLFDLLAPAVPARGGAALSTGEQGGRTLFKSVGHAAQDLALLIHLWSALQEEQKT